MVNSEGVRIVWTAGWVEPGDKGMMVTILGLWPYHQVPPNQWSTSSALA